jgi:hypothetical protein
MAGDVFKVMLSSTFLDLQDHREAVSDAIVGQGMLPLTMKTGSANPLRGIIANSLAMVDEADAYVVLISNYRYGQVIDDPTQNPDRLSVTELEFRRAEARGLPLCIFLVDEDVPVSPREMREEAAGAARLEAFRARARHHSRIVATFASVEELKGQVIETLAKLKHELEKQRVPGQPGIVTQVVQSPTLPKPPAFYAKPPYTPGHAFQGRAQELATLDDWARSADPAMVIEAIGGMGKSMLTWQWVNRRASGLGVEWAGRFWYSFYERGADMRDFKVAALAYMTGQAPETLVKRSEAEVTDELLARLRQQPWLLVLDGLERVLAAYHRSDAAQAQDDDLEGDTGLRDRQPTDCIRPADDDLLRMLPACEPSKLLITSRLMPRVLCPYGMDVPGVAHVALRGLALEDAEAMLRRAGIKGDGTRMRRYLADAFACHPLLVGFVAGLIRHAPWAGMSFERWEDDARGGQAVNIADPSIKNRRDNILKLAFDALEPRARELLARMGMLANAAALDVLEALNPARLDPPKEVREPTPPAARPDFMLDRLRRQLRDAKTGKSRAGLERRIAEHEPARQRDYEAARTAYAAYQSELTAWRDSPELAAASRWLSDTLADLETRGLLQWDRAAGTFDLHPVVRGYAIGHLEDAARAAAGQRVADHFPARPEPNYGKVTSLVEMADRIQVAQALYLARNLPRARDVVMGGMRYAMVRLEKHHELLALLRPLYPDGWTKRPTFDTGRGLVASAAARALSAIGRLEEEGAQEILAITDNIAYGVSADLAICVRNHSFNLRDSNKPALRERALALSLAIAAAAGDNQQILWSDLFRVPDLADHGQLNVARRLWLDVIARPDWRHRNDEMKANGLRIEAWLLHREGALTQTLICEAIGQARALGQRLIERDLWYLLGAWHHTHARHLPAIEAFEHAIQMARDSDLPDPGTEAERGLSLARVNRVQEAETAAHSAERGLSIVRDPPHVALAELWLELGQRDRARDLALCGYKWAWADGPPYCWHWELERCRAVLRALGEPDPPPHDPAKIEPLPYEADINRLLGQHAKQRPT